MPTKAAEGALAPRVAPKAACCARAVVEASLAHAGPAHSWAVVGDLRDVGSEAQRLWGRRGGLCLAPRSCHGQGISQGSRPQDMICGASGIRMPYQEAAWVGSPADAFGSIRFQLTHRHSLPQGHRSEGSGGATASSAAKAARACQRGGFEVARARLPGARPILFLSRTFEATIAAEATSAAGVTAEEVLICTVRVDHAELGRTSACIRRLGCACGG